MDFIYLRIFLISQMAVMILPMIYYYRNELGFCVIADASL